MTNVNEADLNVTHNISEINYIVPSTFTVSMDKAEVTFGQPSTKPTYSGAEQTISLTINGLVGQDVNSGKTATVKMTNVNEADLNVTHNISEVNYIVPSTFTVSIDKAEVTFG
jgi:phage gp45-like